MGVGMRNCINGAKSLLDTQIDAGKILYSGIAFSEYQKVYFSTNENIKEYLELVDYTNKINALSVLGSGDHVFNLINKGILSIDTFDSNKLTEYYALGIKRSLIDKYNYETYLNILSLLSNEETSFDTINNILYDLLPIMDNKYRMFWTEILDYNYKKQKNNVNKLSLIYLLFINIKYSTVLNNYLTNEEEYNKLKTKINNANIIFKHMDAKDLYNEFDKKYDIILLSNILDYFYKIYGYNWKIDELNTYVYKLEKILDINGIVFLNYVYNYYYKFTSRNYNLIRNTNININELDNYVVKKLKYYNNNNSEKVGDGIILYNKK